MAAVGAVDVLAAVDMLAAGVVMLMLMGMGMLMRMRMVVFMFVVVIEMHRFHPFQVIL